MNISIVKILKHIEGALKKELKIGEVTLELIDQIMNDRYTLEDVYIIIDGLNFVSGVENVDRLIATFCINWKLCSGDWDRFLSGELKLENPKKQEYGIEHRYIASVSKSEYGTTDAYLPSSALWSAMEWDIDLNIEDEETLDIWNSEWNIV